MGNEQSVPASRRPVNKLSKPRTNSTTPARSPAAVIRRNSVVLDSGILKNQYNTSTVDVVVVEVGRKRNSSRRSSIFRSKNSQTNVTQLEIQNGVDIKFLNESPVRSESVVQDGWSRSNSVLELKPEQLDALSVQSRPLARTARMSLQHVPYAQHQSRLSLVPEAPTPRESIVRRESILPQRDSLRRRSTLVENPQPEIPPQVPETMTTRTNSDTQLYALTRRKSMMQHGVATRSNFADFDLRQSLPPSASQDLGGFMKDRTNSSLPPLTVLESPRFADYNHNGPRAQTPSDLDYGHIGAYKLGSLRITNGAASPVPSLERSVTVATEEDYMNFRDGRGTPQNPRHGIAQRSHTISTTSDSLKQPWIARAESPLAHNVGTIQAGPLTIATNLPVPDPLFKFSNRVSPTRSQDLARDYQYDIARSPFSFVDSPPVSPTLEATSKHTAIEDDLFAAEPGTPESASPRVFSGPKSHDSGYHAEELPVSSEKSNKRDKMSSKPLAKADSGYSSNVSLRSFKSNKAPSVPLKIAPPTPPKGPERLPSNTYSIASSVYSTTSNVTITASHPLPALPTEYVPPQPLRAAPQVPKKDLVVKKNDQAWLNSQMLQDHSPVIVTPPYGHARTSSTPNTIQERRGSQQTSSGSDSSAPSSSLSSRWRRMSGQGGIQLPPVQPIFTVQASRFTDSQLNNNIPPVSPEASKHLEERIDAFPMSSFPNTIDGKLALRKSSSKETLGTIFSVGSAEWRDEVATSKVLPMPPTIPESPGNGIPVLNRRFTYQPQAPAPMLQSQKQVQHRQSYQPDSPHLKQKIQQDFEDQITSYEHISSSVGKSPYDFATPKSKAKEQERARSITAQFEADAAARFKQRNGLQRATSYDSIAATNPYVGMRTSPRESGARSREGPPSAHANSKTDWTRRRSNSSLRSTSNDESERAMAQKGSAPVEIQTPRRPTTMQSRASLPQLSQPPQPLGSHPPNRTPPQVPKHEQKPISGQWTPQKDYWSGRKEEALKTRKSIELNRPRALASKSQPQLKMRQHPLSLRVGHPSPDSSKKWESYDHTYGSRDVEVENRVTDEEYYDSSNGAAKDYQFASAVGRDSTSDMLKMDFDMGMGRDNGSGIGWRPRPSPITRESLPRILRAGG